MATPSPQHERREQLKVEIRRLFAKHRGTYGSPRIPDLATGSDTGSSNRPAPLLTQTRFISFPGSIATTKASTPAV